MVFLARKNKALDAQASEQGSFRTNGEDEDANEVPEQAPPQATPHQASPSEKSVVSPLDDYKFGVAERLQETVAIKTACSKVKRSPDLVPLSKQFDSLRKRLRQMIATAKKYHESMLVLDKDRLQMAREMSCFAESSPLSSHISSLDEAQSFLSVYQNASNEVARSSKKYQLEVLDYCTEWDAVVTTRIDKEMADIKKLRETYNHYHDKVDVLRKKVNAQEAKGKSANEVVADKVKRNEQKLDEASSEFEAAAGPLCILYEEVIQQGWRDFYPLVQATIKWESDRSQSEARVFQLLQPGALEAAFHRETGIPMKPASVSNNLASPKVHKKKNAQHQPTSPKKKPASQQTGSQKMKPAPLSPNKSALKFESGEDVHSNQFDSSAAYEPAQRKVDSV